MILDQRNEQGSGTATKISDADKSLQQLDSSLSVNNGKATEAKVREALTEVSRDTAIAKYLAEGYVVLPCALDAPSTGGKGKGDRKAPRRIGDNGRPYRLTPAECKETNPDWLDTTQGLGVVPSGKLVIIDIDTKNADQYGGVDAIHKELATRFPALQNAPVERTGSGGLHIFCRVESWAGGFQNWRLEDDGPVLGEIRGAGSFTVVSPTPGYELLNEWGPPPVLENLDGIFVGAKETKAKEPAAATKSKAEPKTEAEKTGTEPTHCDPTGEFLPLKPLVAKTLQSTLKGEAGDDASAALSNLFKELHGWANLLREMGIATENPEGVYLDACQACDRMGKAEAMAKNIDASACVPSLQATKSRDACKDRVRKILSKSVGKEKKSAGTVRLEALISVKNQDTWNGKVSETDNLEKRITSLTMDLLGWESLANEEGYETNDVEQVLTVAVERVGANSEIANQILERLMTGEPCVPAMLKANGGDRDKCVAKLKKAASKRKRPTPGLEIDADSIILSSEDTPGLVALRELFPDEKNWRTINGDIHHFNGTYYEKAEDFFLASKITDVLRRCQQFSASEQGITSKRPYAKSSHVRDALEFIRTAFQPVRLEEVNPSGFVNCTNGVVVLQWNRTGTDFTTELVPHSSAFVFTDKPVVKFDPEADPKHCDRLLECLQADQVASVLRVLAAAIDLEKVRAQKGRSVKTLFFSGDGNNGKDSLREAIKPIMGRRGISACSVQDFKAYDQGRKFGLAGLASSRINWASENDVSARIDNIQSLKQAATGDTLQSEPKHIQGQDFDPRCVLIFNCNGVPNLVAKSQAASSRYAVVPFSKTYTEIPTRPNHVQADSRFKYDLQWVYENVCPALLNRLLAELRLLLKEGIDYSAFEETLEANRLESSHLYLWLTESDFVIDPDGKVDSEIVWGELLQNYKNESCLDDNGRWGEDPRPGDRLVRTKMQLVKRLRPYVPEIKSVPVNGKRYIVGLRIKTAAERETEKKAASEVQQVENPPVNEAPPIPTAEEIKVARKGWNDDLVRVWVDAISKAQSVEAFEQTIADLTPLHRSVVELICSGSPATLGHLQRLGIKPGWAINGISPTPIT